MLHNDEVVVRYEIMNSSVPCMGIQADWYHPCEQLDSVRFSLEIKLHCSCLTGTVTPESHAQCRSCSQTSRISQEPTTAAFCAFTMPRCFRMGGVITSMKPVNEREHERVNQSTSTRKCGILRTPYMISYLRIIYVGEGCESVYEIRGAKCG